MWAKGKGKYPGNWDKIKDIVISKANYECEVCHKKPKFKSIYGSEVVIIILKDFRVHHIDQNKSNNVLSNLMFVCKKCHGKLHRELNRAYNGL